VSLKTSDWSVNNIVIAKVSDEKDLNWLYT